ncbi:MAG: SANT/Myb domain-containing protein [Sphingomonadales bacterium]|nr:SANT/Myb domain-containing protein [Sphingomonadales bacterium]
MIEARRPWTAQEELTLRQMAPDHKWADIAKVLNRSPRAVQKYAVDRRILRATDGRDWSPSDINRLRSEYPHMTTAVVAELLGRTASSVRAKAYELGIMKDPGFISNLRQGLARKAAIQRSTSAFLQGRAGRFDREGGVYTPTQDAVHHLQKIGPIWRCRADGTTDPKGDHWKFNGRVMDAAAVEARAERAGWVRP